MIDYQSAIISHASSSPPLATLTAESHPDAALLAAWAGLVKASRAFDQTCNVPLPNNGTDADHEPYRRAIEFYESQIERHQASTVEGFAVQLRYLFAKNMECIASFKAAIYGEQLNEELAATLDKDYRDKMLWDMAQAATQASQIGILTDLAGESCHAA